MLVVLPLVGVPDISIRRENSVDRLASAIGIDDIDFESAEFNSLFRVRSSSKRFAYDLIHPRMMEFILKTCPPGLDIQRGFLCLSNGRSTWSPQVFGELLPWLAELFEHWPRHVDLCFAVNAQNT
jgi:hypothetical protein